MEKGKNRTDKPDDGTDIYVGSTSQPLNYLLYCHKYSAKNFLRLGYSENNLLYMKMSRVGVQNWEILPLLGRMCDIKTIRELERKWISVLQADLDTNSPVREEKTVQEYGVNYYKANKEAIRAYQKDYQKEYYKANKEAIREYQKEYYKSNKEATRQKRQTTTV